MNFSPKLEVNSTGNNTRIIGFCVWNVLRNPNFSEFNWSFYNLKFKNKWISKKLPWYYLKCVFFYRKSIRSIGIVRFLLWIEYVRLRASEAPHGSHRIRYPMGGRVNTILYSIRSLFMHLKITSIYSDIWIVENCHVDSMKMSNHLCCCVFFNKTKVLCLKASYCNSSIIFLGLSANQKQIRFDDILHVLIFVSACTNFNKGVPCWNTRRLAVQSLPSWKYP